MSDDIVDVIIGSFTKELRKAREEALIRAIDKGYRTNLHWRIYSEDSNRIELWGCNKLLVPELLARIRISQDLRPFRPTNSSVTTEHFV